MDHGCSCHPRNIFCILCSLKPSTRRLTGAHLSPVASSAGQKKRCHKRISERSLDKPYRSPKRGAGNRPSFVDQKSLLASDVLVKEYRTPKTAKISSSVVLQAIGLKSKKSHLAAFVMEKTISSSPEAFYVPLLHHCTTICVYRTEVRISNLQQCHLLPLPSPTSLLS